VIAIELSLLRTQDTVTVFTRWQAGALVVTLASLAFVSACQEQLPDSLTRAPFPNGGEANGLEPTSSPSDAPQLPLVLCESGAVASCTSLSALFVGGEATCRASQTGYDISTCERLPASESKRVEAVRPAHRSGRHSAARCNAGEPFAFQVRLASPPSKSWVVHLEGGGACDDVSLLCKTRAGCLLERSDVLFHGPKLLDRQLDEDFPGYVEGVLSHDRADINPVADSNHVFAYYCSSDNWAGARTNAVWTTDNAPGGLGPWYFAGHLSVRALFETLFEGYGLDDSDAETRVLFTGTSAGGVGIVANTEHVAAMLPNAARDGRYRVVVDAGTFLGQEPNVESSPTLGWEVCDQTDPKLPDEQVLTRAIRGVWGAAIGPECLRMNADEPGRCLMTAHAKDAWTKLRIPHLVQQSQLDLPWMSIYTGTVPANNALEGLALQSYFAARLRAQLEGVKWVYAAGDRRIPGLGNFHTLISYDLGLEYCTVQNPLDMGACLTPTFGEVLTRFLASSFDDPGERVIADLNL